MYRTVEYKGMSLKGILKRIKEIEERGETIFDFSIKTYGEREK